MPASRSKGTVVRKPYLGKGAIRLVSSVCRVLLYEQGTGGGDS